MLREIGVPSIDGLFAPIPAQYRLNRDLKVPRQMAESEVVDYFRTRAAENAVGYALFLGAGAYAHYRPVLIDALSSRGEFFTAYTPYQAEIAQGTLQAIFEFQSMICELTGMEVANASMYDGSTAIPESVMMAARITGRSAAVVARSVHPEHREVLATYGKHQGLSVSTVAFGENGRVDLAAVEKAVTDGAACVVIQSPNFFGTIEDVATVAELAHQKGALLVVSISEAISLGAVKPPAEADIVAMEAQSFGVPLGFGGPYVGVLATREKFVRQMPGRLAGQTVDTEGRRGFVLTLATREQHIRRERATSNICTSQTLCALMATIYLCLLGKKGLRMLAEQNLAKAYYARQQLVAAGATIPFSAPCFNEFVVEPSGDAEELLAALREEKIIGGLKLERFYA